MICFSFFSSVVFNAAISSAYFVDIAVVVAIMLLLVSRDAIFSSFAFFSSCLFLKATNAASKLCVCSFKPDDSIFACAKSASNRSNLRVCVSNARLDSNALFSMSFCPSSFTLNSSRMASIFLFNFSVSSSCCVSSSTRSLVNSSFFLLKSFASFRNDSKTMVVCLCCSANAFSLATASSFVTPFAIIVSARLFANSGVEHSPMGDRYEVVDNERFTSDVLNFRSGDALDETGVVVIVVVSSPSSSSNPDKSCSSPFAANDDGGSVFSLSFVVVVVIFIANGFVSLSFSIPFVSLFVINDADKFALLINDNSVISISERLDAPPFVQFFNHVIRTLHLTRVTPLSIRISCVVSNPCSLRALVSVQNLLASKIPLANVVLFPQACNLTLYAFGSNCPVCSRYKVTICVSLLLFVFSSVSSLVLKKLAEFVFASTKPSLVSDTLAPLVSKTLTENTFCGRLIHSMS
mmetsp:Transcript_7771/g.24385  ORF Transcript_7771/g.24385 Transcript_7771/m.24385 type:complete len:464 (-) Transcript_7771:207-1598(-)